MNLIVHELGAYGLATLTQRLTTPADRDVRVGALRPHLLKFLAPAGSLYMEIRKTDTTLISTSSVVTIAAITADTGNYFHGYVAFPIYCTLARDTSYDFILASTGYTFAEAAWIGWCNDFDLQKYDRDYTPANFEDCPLDIEVWEHKLITKGTYP